MSVHTCTGWDQGPPSAELMEQAEPRNAFGHDNQFSPPWPHPLYWQSRFLSSPMSASPSRPLCCWGVQSPHWPPTPLTRQPQRDLLQDTQESQHLSPEMSCWSWSPPSPVASSSPSKRTDPTIHWTLSCITQPWTILLTFIWLPQYIPLENRLGMEQLQISLELGFL